MTAARDKLKDSEWVERLFEEFVRNANAVGDMERTARGPAPEARLHLEIRSDTPEWPESGAMDCDADASGSLAAITIDQLAQDDIPTPDVRPRDAVSPSAKSVPEPVRTSSGNILLLTRKKLPTVAELEAQLRPASVVRLPKSGQRPSESDSVVDRMLVHRAETHEVVPELDDFHSDTPIPERSESGRMPARELDRVLHDVDVLLRYGHFDDAQELVDDVRTTYPEDLLLVRRLSELFLSHDDRDTAIQYLFELAANLFHRGNLIGMGRALEQVLVLRPGHAQAERLLGLLKQREQA